MRFASVALGLGALLLAGTALSAPRGKVVRVERGKAQASAARFCAVIDSPEKPLCLGKPPKDGELITFLDPRAGGVIGTARVDSTSPAKNYACPGREPTIFDTNVTIQSGDRDVIARGYAAALRGVKLDDRAKIIEDYPAPNPNEQSVVIAVDSDSSGTADVVILQYSCDAQGTFAPNGSGAGMNINCYDTYIERGGQLARTHKEIIEICY